LGGLLDGTGIGLIVIPADAAGPYTLSAIGRSTAGDIMASEAVTLSVVPPTPIQALDVRPAELEFGGVGESAHLSVRARYQDGTVGQIVEAPTFRVVSGAGVAVDAQGRVVAVAKGSGVIEAADAGLTVDVPFNSQAEDKVNEAPIAHMGGPYLGCVGQPIQLTADGSWDSELSLAGTLTYSWDLDDDGNYDNASGESACLTPKAPGTTLIGLRVVDGGGLTSTDHTLLVVDPSCAQPEVWRADLMPGACPNRIVVGIVGPPVEFAILGDECRDVHLIDTGTLRLGGHVVPIGASYEDRAGLPSGGGDCLCGSPPDGREDLVLLFDRTEIAGFLPDGTDSVSVSVEGLLTGGAPMFAHDCVRAARRVRTVLVTWDRKADVLRLSLGNGVQARVEVFDVLGRRLVTLHSEGPGGQVQWGTRGRPSGVYFARVSLGHGHVTRKFIIVR